MFDSLQALVVSSFYDFLSLLCRLISDDRVRTAHDPIASSPKLGVRISLKQRPV